MRKKRRQRAAGLPPLWCFHSRILLRGVGGAAPLQRRLQKSQLPTEGSRTSRQTSTKTPWKKPSGRLGFVLGRWAMLGTKAVLCASL